MKMISKFLVIAITAILVFFASGPVSAITIREGSTKIHTFDGGARNSTPKPKIKNFDMLGNPQNATRMVIAHKEKLCGCKAKRYVGFPESWLPSAQCLYFDV